MTLTVEDLLAAGYQTFHDSHAASKLPDWYQASYQKRFTDPLGIRYFITIVHNVMPANFSRSGLPSKTFFTPSNQFSRGGVTFNVEMLHYTESLDQVESFFADLWESMHLDYYEMQSERHSPQPADANAA